jgi:GNAT superfamily N-acetyltransferase
VAVRKASTIDVPRLATALAKAFHEDPVFVWLFPNDTERLRRSERGFALYLRKMFLPQGESYAADDCRGAALWLPPGKWHLSPLAQLRLLPGMVRAMGPRLPHVLRALDTIESVHPRTPHHYLAFVGVEPKLQGKGIGTALLRPILDRCDRQRTAAYLEATTARNRAFYLRLGFEVTAEFRYPKGGPPSCQMWREPRG